MILQLSNDLAGVHLGASSLSGEFGALSPSDLFEVLTRARKSGLLVCENGADERALLFRDGRPTWGSSSVEGERLHELLCRFELADRAAALMARVHLNGQAMLNRQVWSVLSGYPAQSSGTFSLHERWRLVNARPLAPPAPSRPARPAQRPRLHAVPTQPPATPAAMESLEALLGPQGIGRQTG